MTVVRKGLGAAIALALAAFSSLEAQEGDGRVLRPGELGLSIRGEYLHFTRRFGEDGSVALGAELGGALTPATLPALEPLASGVASFFTATQGEPFPIEPSDLAAGHLGVAFGWNRRNVPISLGVGLAPRVALSATMTLYRDERFPRRLSLDPGTLGLNPNPSGNAAILAGMEASLSELGSSSVLPLEDSRVGAELQRRVESATGSRLELPTEALTGGDLVSEFEIHPYPHRIGLWQPGDLEVAVRLAVLSTFGDAPLPPRDSEISSRLAVQASARFPTGRQSADHPLYGWGPPVGHAGFGASATGDLFIRDRLWITAGGDGRVIREADAQLALSPFPPLADEAEVLTGRRRPGTEVDVWLTPRLRLSEEISLGAAFRAEYRGEGSERVGALERDVAGGTRHSVGFTLHYSNLTASDAGESRLPIEMRVGFRASLLGAEGLPATRHAYAQIDILRRLWSRPTALR